MLVDNERVQSRRKSGDVEVGRRKRTNRTPVDRRVYPNSMKIAEVEDRREEGRDYSLCLLHYSSHEKLKLYQIAVSVLSSER